MGKLQPASLADASQARALMSWVWLSWVMSGRHQFVIEDGDGTLLDHSVILATSDVSYGRTHSLDDYPIVLAGSCGGKLKTGLHYRSPASENASKVIVSIARAMDVSLASFGEGDAKSADGLSAIEAG